MVLKLVLFCNGNVNLISRKFLCSCFQGDGLEFKRHFIKVKGHMKSISSKVPPVFPLVPSQASQAVS